MSTIKFWKTEDRGHRDKVVTRNFYPENVNRHTIIFASITEISQPPNQPMDFPFLGAAKMTVNNIVPFDDGRAKFLVTIDWNDDLNFRLNIITIKVLG